MNIALAHITAMGAAHVKSAVVLHKINSPVQPDFYAKKVMIWRWIIYPWAVMEDLTAFIFRMEKIPATPEQAQKKIERDYQVRVPLNILKDIYRFHNLS